MGLAGIGGVQGHRYCAGIGAPYLRSRTFPAKQNSVVLLPSDSTPLINIGLSHIQTIHCTGSHSQVRTSTNTYLVMYFSVPLDVGS